MEDIYIVIVENSDKDFSPAVLGPFATEEEADAKRKQCASTYIKWCNRKDINIAIYDDLYRTTIFCPDNLWTRWTTSTLRRTH